MANKILKDSEEIKKYLSNEFSLTFSNLVEQELENKRKDGISYFEKDIYTKMGISKGAFNFYKNGNDGRGTEAKEKVPDLVGLYKIKNYFNVPYSYLLNETNTKDINNLEIGMTLGLTDESISMLNNLYNSKANNDKSKNDKEFELFILNCIISNDEFIHRLSKIVIDKLSRRVANEKYKKIGINHSENNDYINFQKFKLSNITNSIIDEITNRDDIPIHMMEELKKKPRHIDSMKFKRLEEELKRLEDEEINNQ